MRHSQAVTSMGATSRARRSRLLADWAWPMGLAGLVGLLGMRAAEVFGASGFLAYPSVPGLPPSEHFRARVRPATGREPWAPAFVWQTSAKNDRKNPEKYPPHMAGWTHSYINVEMGGPIEIELSRSDQRPIVSAVPHPLKKVASVTIRGGKAYVVLAKPCLVAVDIDGQMDEQNTGMGYRGRPIHAVSIFANPPVKDRPGLGDPSVFYVKPGQVPPSEGPWKTLYFLPGIHDVGAAFPVHANRQYFIPGDAMVYGGFSNQKKWNDGHNIRIFGLGTLSGARLKHPDFADVRVRATPALHNPIDIAGAVGTTVEGITIADAAHHSVMLMARYTPDQPTNVRWVKILNWRINGDGINPFGNGLIEDCFIRTQDDSLYVSGRGIRRTVLWNDYNGSSFVLSSLPQLTERTLAVEDCDVIYSRAGWHKWSGGRVFNMRGEGGGDCGAGVIFRNINVEDPRPTLQQFFIAMTVPGPYSSDGPSRRKGDLSKAVFENVSIAAPSVLGEPQLLWGAEGARIDGLIFRNLTVGGRPVTDASFFKTNGFVGNLAFEADAKGAKSATGE